jgi:hypothetical protein
VLAFILASFITALMLDAADFRDPAHFSSSREVAGNSSNLLESGRNSRTTCVVSNMRHPTAVVSFFS